jgi:hypothetical protein
MTLVLPPPLISLAPAPGPLHTGEGSRKRTRRSRVLFVSGPRTRLPHQASAALCQPGFRRGRRLFRDIRDSDKNFGDRPQGVSENLGGNPPRLKPQSFLRPCTAPVRLPFAGSGSLRAGSEAVPFQNGQERGMQGLKPQPIGGSYGTAEAVPFQNTA